MKKTTPKKIFVAMSGGVDSSVTALLLKQQGYDVTGVYMKNWSEESFDGQFAKYCPWRKDLADVRRVCKTLKIPVKVYNFEKYYNKRIIDDFFAKEKKGLTPNPDVVCNREIKFGIFLKTALAQGAQGIATGHYAQVSRNTNRIFELKRAKDKNKDQTYFLCTVRQNQLKYALFPLGTYTKDQVRELARKHNIPTAEKPESMGICFVGEVNFQEFLRARIPETPGDVVDEKGTVLGKHRGLPFYTIGQRQGLNIAGALPYYVVAKKKSRNQLVVAQGAKNDQLFQKEVRLSGVSWITGQAPKFPAKVHCMIRYRQEPQAGTLKKTKSGVIVSFHRKQRAVTPGQYCAIYQGDILLGGGVIK